MKFRLRDGFGQTAIGEIGLHLRTYGSGHHWFERFRGEIFIHPGVSPDEEILLKEFADVLEPVEDEPK